jgi:7-cyano-7-deazaguanine synthase
MSPASIPVGSSAVVVFSGGQDSTTCLAWALARFARVEALAIDYGQRHRVELDAASAVCREAQVPLSVVPCNSFRALGGNSLTGTTAVEHGVVPSGRLPNTFVPGRNLVFLTLAAAFAWQRGISDLVTGVCQTDYSGYPDCRAETMTALQAALRAGLDHPVTIHTPLMYLTKAQTVTMMQELGHLELLAWSHTCYEGAVPPCGQCPACLLRAKGFAEAGIADPLLARVGG